MLSNQPWVIIVEPYLNKLVFDDYFKGLSKIHNLKFINSNNINIIHQELSQYTDIKEVSILIGFSKESIHIYNYLLENNYSISILNTEPLNIKYRLNFLLGNLLNLKIKKIYDYSLSNIQILNQINFKNVEYLPYNVSFDEKYFLSQLNLNTKKEYDFGFITNIPNNCERRSNVINHLISKGYKINIINAWGETRDRELAKCKYILNIHGFLTEPSKIFEHIRCDRLLESGFNIISEDCYYLDKQFINKYSNNLILIPYNWFFKLNNPNEDILNKFENKKVIDGFIFYNELDMLQLRLKEMNDEVDYFILVESTKTFTNKPKELYYENNKKQFVEYENKIIHITVENMPDGESYSSNWDREAHQRNSIKIGIDKLNLKDEDIIFISDVDEIIDPKIINIIKTSNINNIYSLTMDFYYYNLNYKVDHSWLFAKVLNFGFLNKINLSLHQLRLAQVLNITNKAGWHLSYFGDIKFIINKIKNFCHQEHNKEEFLDEKRLENIIKNGEDLFDRDMKLSYIKFEDNNYLPNNYKLLLKN